MASPLGGADRVQNADPDQIAALSKAALQSCILPLALGRLDGHRCERVAGCAEEPGDVVGGRAHIELANVAREHEGVEQQVARNDRAKLYWWTAYIVSENYSSSISGRCASLPQNAIKVSIPNPLLEPSVGHLCPVFVTTARGSAKACRATEGVAFLKILHFALKLSRLAT